jgi:hypothetical protein
MKNLIFILFSSLLIFNLSVAYAQGSEIGQGIRIQEFQELLQNVKDNTKLLENSTYDGSPFLNESFSPTEIFINDISKGIYFMRYNVYNDRFQIKDKENPPYNNILKVDYIVLKHENKLFKIFEFEPKSRGTKKGYFQVLNEGSKCSLLLKLEKKYRPEKKAKNSFQKDISAKFSDFQSFYLKFNNKLPTKVSLKNKTFLKTFPYHNNTIMSYIKHNKLNIKNPNDLIKIITYYNSL